MPSRGEVDFIVEQVHDRDGYRDVAEVTEVSGLAAECRPRSVDQPANLIPGWRDFGWVSAPARLVSGETGHVHEEDGRRRLRLRRTLENPDLQGKGIVRGEAGREGDDGA